MEISGSVLPRALIGSIDRRSRVRIRIPTRASCGGVTTRGGSLFSDEAHLEYYGGTKEKEDKKRAKLIKGVKKDLEELTCVGFGTIEADQSNKISEMAAQLLEQLDQLKTKEKEMKKKKKEEKSAMKRGTKEKCEDSSSSSSESSESDCEESKILRFSDLKTPIVPFTTTDLSSKPQIMISSNSRKVEVCMGGKCKKNGSIELLKEIEKRVGIEGVVVGCKCMGRCKEGPNVCVSNNGMLEEEKSSLLCVGVGLGDVDNIVSNFFQGDLDDSGLENQVMIV